jgi:Gpi18-like mannosyltransferase
MKLAIMATEWLALWYVYKWTDKKIPFYWLVLISTLNLGFSYNTLIWAQIDGMVAAFLFISIYYGHHRKLVPSALFFILALNTKMQAIVFLPIWGFFFLQYVFERRDIKSFAMPLAAMAVAQLIILIPFLGRLSQLLTALDAVDTFQYISVMAFNYWHIVIPDVWNLSDRGVYVAGLTYKQFGLLAFFTFSLLVLFPMLRVLFFKIRSRHSKVELDKVQIWLMCALVALGFFFFNTQMHERYSHPTIIFLTALAVYHWYYLIPYIVFSLAYFANMERASNLLGLPLHTALFDHVYIAYEFLFVLVFLLISLWLSFRQKQLQ